MARMLRKTFNRPSMKENLQKTTKFIMKNRQYLFVIGNGILKECYLKH